MATNTFERKIEVSDIGSVKKLVDIMAEDVSVSPLTTHPFSEIERERSAELLRQCPLRSNR